MISIEETKSLFFSGKETTFFYSYDSQIKSKILLKVLSNKNPSKKMIKEFENEFFLSSYNHSPVLRKVFGKTTFNEMPALILEFIDGLTVDTIISEKTLQIEDFLSLAIRIVRALEKLHSDKIIHKNLTGNNILLDNFGNIYFIDLGLAVKLHSGSILKPSIGIIEGNLTYIPPEQTGRINISICPGSDLYSLGILFYRMITGEFPFISQDPLELIHSHIAATPIPPHIKYFNVPEQISGIIMHLLEKDPNNRYISATGLLFDLEHCLDKWNREGKITAFKLGIKDFCGELIFPGRIYGREKDLSTLQEVYKSVSLNSSSILLVSGFTGVGKTTLIHELLPLVTSTGGFFIEGKFNPLNLSGPYSAWISALSNFVDIILSLPDYELEWWKNQILTSLGNVGKVLTDIFPSLLLLTGPQPEVPELGGIETKNRFNFVFLRFIQTISTFQHPLVIFLDDLQWIDESSLELIQTIFNYKELHSLLIIGSFRDNEVPDFHPLKNSIIFMKSQGIAIHEIHLQDLCSQDIGLFLSEIFHCSQISISPVSEILSQKSGGNIFIVKQLLSSLIEKGDIRFSSESGAWKWDFQKISSLPISDNVVELMIQRISCLSLKITSILSIAACIGSPFTEDLISLILHNEKKTEIKRNILILEEEGFIFRDGTFYFFSHDGIQQAAHELLEEKTKQKIHKNIGKILIEISPDYESRDLIFTIVHHFMFWITKDDSDGFFIELARLCLIAGKRARKTNAYLDAFEYFQKGISCLLPGGWDIRYDLMLPLYQGAIESAFLSRKYETMQELADTFHVNVRNILDKIPVIIYEINYLGVIGKMLEAIEYGTRVLNEIGFKIPENPTTIEVIHSFDETLHLLNKVTLEGIDDLPDLQSEKILRGLQVIEVISFPLYAQFPERYAINSSIQVFNTLELGKSVISPIAFCSFAGSLNFIGENYKLAYEIGKKGVELIPDCKAEALESAILFKYASLIQPWIEHYSHIVKNFAKSISKGYEIGDYSFIGYSALHQVTSAFLAGEPLTSIIKISEENHNITSNLDLYHIQFIIDSFLECANTLYDEGRNHELILDNDFWVELAERTSFWHGLCVYYSIQMIKSLYIHDDSNILEYAENSMKYINSIVGSFGYPSILFYYCLAILRCCTIYPEMKLSLLENIQINLEKIEKIANSCPDNFQHKFFLIKAEMARVIGDNETAMLFYEKAITGAHEKKYLNEEIIACEMAGNFWYQRDMKNIARFYLEKTRSACIHWEAYGMVHQLEEYYKDIFTSHNDNHNSSVIYTETNLDFLSILKALQAISEEIDLKKLVRILMLTVIKNAGAERGILILEHDDIFSIEADFIPGKDYYELMLGIPLNNCESAPFGIIQNAIRKKETIILSNVSTDCQYTHDEKIKKLKLKSVLCIPLISGCILKGAIYLENNLIEGAFTSDRVSVTKILASQAIISLTNARLYNEQRYLVENLERENSERKRIEAELVKYQNQLEDLVTVRTKELEIAKLHAEKASQAKSMFLSAMSHELRTPLNAIIGFSQILRKSENLTCKQISQLITIQNSGGHLLTLISDLLDLGKIEVNKMNIDFKPFNLSYTIMQIFEISDLKAHEKNLTLLYNPINEIPKFVLGDELKIKQILLNLITNAIKYTHKGSVSFRTGYNPDKEIFFAEIEDTGIGIPPDKKEEIFVPFSQLNNDKNLRDGIGLGLSITKRLVEIINGTLDFSSIPGQGTTFIFTVPLPRVSVTDKLLDTESILGYEGEKKSVLVIDDNEDNASLLMAFIEPLGFNVHCINNGYTAFQYINEHISDVPSLIFLDLVMPGMDGYDLLQKWRNLYNPLPFKIIGISATVYNTERKEEFKNMCDGFIEKPINYSHIIQSVKNLLNITWIKKPDSEKELDLSGISDKFVSPHEQVPEKYILNEIRSIVNSGDYQKFEQKLEEIIKKDINYSSFCNHLYKLSQNYDDFSILEYIDQISGGNCP